MIYDEFVQRVRRFRCSDVLAGAARASVALTSAELDNPVKQPFGRHSPVKQFSLAAVAKAALVFGNDHRSTQFTPSALEWLCGSLIEVDDPFSDDPNEPGAIRSWLIRTAYEQFSWQINPHYELGRTHALLNDAAASANQDLITPDFWHRVLGCSLTDFVGVALLLHIGALKNAGIFDPSWLQQQNFEPVVRRLPRERIESVSASLFLTDQQGFRRLAANPLRAVDRKLRRYEFNPLIVRPLVKQPDGRCIAPLPIAVLRRASPEALYYIGAECGGADFTEALGAVFETYVGQQLQLLEPQQLLGEVEYKQGSRSADWIVVLPDVVLIVEAKATPLRMHSRLGTSQLDEDLQRAPGKGVRQILDTAALIRSGHPKLGDIPTDRPIVGLIATLHPYYTCHADLVWPRNPADIPILLASAAELEALVALNADPGALLLDLAQADNSSLSQALSGVDVGRNALLAAAWQQYPFSGEELKSSD